MSLESPENCFKIPRKLGPTYEEKGREFSFIQVFVLKQNSKGSGPETPREVEKTIEKEGAEILGDYLNPKKITRTEEL